MKLLKLVKWLGTVLRRGKSRETPTDAGRHAPEQHPASTDQQLAERLQAMMDAGLIKWNGQKLGQAAPRGRVHGERTVADLIVEDREYPFPSSHK